MEIVARLPHTQAQRGGLKAPLYNYTQSTYKRRRESMVEKLIEDVPEEDETRAKFLKAQEEFVAERTVRFDLLDDTLVLVMRIVSNPVWTHILISNGVTALSMNAQDMKANKADDGKSLQIHVKAQMDANRSKIIDALIDRAGIDIPKWFKADMLDESLAGQFIDDYALEMRRISKSSGREEATMEKFRNYGLLTDDGSDEQGTSGEDPEPTCKTIPDPV